MRLSLSFAIVLGVLAAVDLARADPAVFPDFDIAKTCAAQADYAFAATLGQQDRTREIAACSVGERENRFFAKTLWTQASLKDQRECLALADGKYGYLARCLDAGRPLSAAK